MKIVAVAVVTVVTVHLIIAIRSASTASKQSSPGWLGSFPNGNSRPLSIESRIYSGFGELQYFLCKQTLAEYIESIQLFHTFQTDYYARILCLMEERPFGEWIRIEEYLEVYAGPRIRLQAMIALASKYQQLFAFYTQNYNVPINKFFLQMSLLTF